MSAITELKRTITELWSLVVGLKITGKEFVRPQLTVHYPRQAVDNLSTFRGHIELVGKPGKPAEPKCITCMLCASLCPSTCISIKKAAPAPKPAAQPMPEADGSALGPVIAPQKMPPPKATPSKTPTGFTLDYTLCSLCGMCVQNCPVDSLRFSTDVYLAGESRQEFHYDLLARLRDQAAVTAADEKAQDAPAAPEGQTGGEG